MIFGHKIFLATLLTNLIPYIVELLLIVKSYCALKLKKENEKQKSSFFRSETKTFNFERRYAQMGATFLLAFTYGYAIPTLFILLLANVVLATIVDRVLITYWMRP